jgi:hypothetical protein
MHLNKGHARKKHHFVTIMRHSILHSQKKLLKYHMGTTFWKATPLSIVDIGAFIGGNTYETIFSCKLYSCLINTLLL